MGSGPKPEGYDASTTRVERPSRAVPSQFAVPVYPNRGPTSGTHRCEPDPWARLGGLKQRYLSRHPAVGPDIQQWEMTEWTPTTPIRSPASLHRRRSGVRRRPRSSPDTVHRLHRGVPRRPHRAPTLGVLCRPNPFPNNPDGPRRRPPMARRRIQTLVRHHTAHRPRRTEPRPRHTAHHPRPGVPPRRRRPAGAAWSSASASPSLSC